MPDLKKLGLKNKVAIVKDTRPFAFCLGIKNAHIYISTKTVSMATKKELLTILLHEKYHLEHSDSLTLFVASLPQILFPFFPLLKKLIDSYKIEREIKADTQAVKYFQTTKYTISILKKMLKNPQPTPAFVSSIADSATLEIRINHLMNKNVETPQIRIKEFLISLLSLSVLIAAITLPVHAVEVTTSKQKAVVVCLESKNCASICKSNNFILPYSSPESRVYSSVR